MFQLILVFRVRRAQYLHPPRSSTTGVTILPRLIAGWPLSSQTINAELFSIITTASRPSPLYFLPKIHKLDNSGIPRTSFSSPTERVSVYIDAHLQLIVKSSYYSVRKVSDRIFFKLKYGGFQWSTLTWSDLEPSYPCMNFFPPINTVSWWQAVFEWGSV